MYVLDTNMLIYFFKGEGRVAENLLAQPPATIAVPTIVLYELHAGILKSHSPRKLLTQLEDFQQTVEVLDFGTTEARSAAEIRARLESAGEPIGPYDILIAATARAHGGTLVSRNQREFGRVAGLQTVDWFE